MQVNLVAVQPKMELGDYASFSAFADKMASLMDQVARAIDPEHPALVAFPEYLGMYLGFVPYHGGLVADEATMTGAVAKIVEKHAAGVDPQIRSDPRALAQYLLFVEHATETERAYMDTFAQLARAHGVYLVAGSLCVPPRDQSPHRDGTGLHGGRFVLDPGRVHNQSYLFSPQGICLGRTSKIHIPPGENLLLDGAAESDLVPSPTAIGRIATLLCFDGYHHRPIERVDALGADLVVHPLYYAGPGVRFDGSGQIVPRPFDFASLIQGRERIQYGIASALVGAVFQDRRAEGVSFIARNTGNAEAPPEDAILARSEDVYAEAIVSSVVDVAESFSAVEDSGTSGAGKHLR